MSKKAVMQISTPEKFEEFIKKMSGTTLTKVSRGMGLCDPYLQQSIKRGRISKSGFVALSKELGVTEEKLAAYMNDPAQEAEQQLQETDEVLNMLAQIYEMEKRQTEALQRLVGMFERTWCR